MITRHFLTQYFCIMVLSTKGENMKGLKSRVVWGFSPITRVKASKKVYSRKKITKMKDW